MCWVKIQESKMLKFSKLTIFIFSESNFQEEAPYLLRPPPYIGVGICYGPPWLYRFIVLYCTTVLSYKDLFFPRFIAIFFGAKYPHTPSLDKLLCQIFICTEFCEVSFLLFSYIYCIERHN